MHKNEVYYIPGALLISAIIVAMSIYSGAELIAKSGIAGASDVAKKAPSQVTETSVKVPPVTSADHIKGKMSAKVVIIEYSDTACPFCKRFHTTLEQITKTFNTNEVAWVYRHFPLDKLHSKARKEAEATECAADQGGNAKFWQYTDKLYEITPSNNKLESSELVTIAKLVNLDTKKFEACLTSGKFAAKVEADRLGGANAGARGTPYSFLVTSKGSTPVNGAVSFETLKSQIESVLSTQ